MLRNSARSLGIFRAQWLADYYRLRQPSLPGLLAAWQEEGLVVPVNVEALGEMWLHHEALAQLGIAALAEDDFGALSGGQQQLVLIARALVSASQNILLDEPCSALDLGNQQVVLQLIGDLAHRQARTVLFTTHDPNHALQVASHTLLLLPEGRWLAGETADVLSETHLRQAYGLPVRLIRHAASAFPLLAPGFTLRR